MLPNFYYTPEILNYDFGPNHPLRPERLRRTIELLARYEVEPIDPGNGRIEDLLRVHSVEFVTVVLTLSNVQNRHGRNLSHGFGSGDNPPFAGMYESALAYCSATVAAAEKVRDGANLAFAIGGGLHHANKDRASGFCIFNDPAIACHVLLDRFDRVAYIDIDVHHGDGVQWIFYDEPRVLTCSIHEDGRTLFPGTGHVSETGKNFTSFNVPIEAYTTGDVWLNAFRNTIPLAIERFEPQAIVLQMGTDPHYLDPLAHIQCFQQHWLEAVKIVAGLGLPIVAVGGGGYRLTCVPRMWASACLTLGGAPYDDALPPDLAEEWEMPTYSDHISPFPSSGQAHADAVVEWLQTNHIPNIQR